VDGKNWQEALKYTEGLSLAGYDDWRLPTTPELQTIVDFNRYNPAIDVTFFPGTVLSYYWSFYSSADSDLNAWCVHFYNGYVSLYYKTYGYASAPFVVARI